MEHGAHASRAVRSATNGTIALTSLVYDVVGVDVLARRDRGGRLADDLAVLADGIAAGDPLERDLVAARMASAAVTVMTSGPDLTETSAPASTA